MHELLVVRAKLGVEKAILDAQRDFGHDDGKKDQRGRRGIEVRVREGGQHADGGAWGGQRMQYELSSVLSHLDQSLIALESPAEDASLDGLVGLP